MTNNNMFTEKRLREIQYQSSFLQDEELQQILENQVTAQKYNDLMNANSEVVQQNIDITKEHQIVQLIKKIDVEILQDSIKDYLVECDKDYEASGHDGLQAQAYVKVHEMMKLLIILKSILEKQA